MHDGVVHIGIQPVVSGLLQVGSHPSWPHIENISPAGHVVAIQKIKIFSIFIYRFIKKSSKFEI